MSSGLSSQQLPVQAEPVANVRSFLSPKCLASSSKPGACNSKSLALVEQTENERLAAAPAAAAADGYVCVGGERRGGGRGEGGEGGEWNRGAGVVEEEKEESGSADVDDHDMDMGERAIADPALAGVDFFMEEPATRSQAHPQSLVEYSPWASGQKVGRHRREEEDDQEMAIHEPAHRWGDLDGSAGGLDDDDDGIELLNLGQLPEGHGLGGEDGSSTGKVTSVRAFMHVLKSYIGSGVLGLPYAYAQAHILKSTLYTDLVWCNVLGH
jgi:hypothetical protein